MIQQLSRIAGWIGLAFVVFATLAPFDARPVVARQHFEHFGAFALLGLTFTLGYPRRVGMTVAIVIGSAFVLEALQLLTSERHGRLIDALVKASGGLTGLGLGCIASLLLRGPLATITAALGSGTAQRPTIDSRQSTSARAGRRPLRRRVDVPGKEGRIEGEAPSRHPVRDEGVRPEL